MLQRIQSLYLFVGAALTALFFFFPEVAREWPSAVHWSGPIVLGVLGGILVIGGIGSIFLYGDRTLQKKVVVGLQWVTVLFVLVLYGSLWQGDLLRPLFGGVINIVQVVALLIPVVVYVNFYLARRNIQKDIELVESMDRLR